MIALAIAVVGAIVLALLVLPVRVRAWANAGSGARLRVDLRLMGGLLPWIALVDTDRLRQRGGTSARRVLVASRRPAPAQRLRRAGPGLVLEALRRLRLEVCRVDLRFGLEDPAMTGILFGRLAPVMALRWALPPQAVLRLTPEFSGAVLAGEAVLRLSLVPLRMVPLVARLLWALRP